MWVYATALTTNMHMTLYDFIYVQKTLERKLDPQNKGYVLFLL